jgi:hypothetical protein
MARSSECTDEYAQNELIEPTLSETLIDLAGATEGAGLGQRWLHRPGRFDYPGKVGGVGGVSQ